MSQFLSNFREFFATSYRVKSIIIQASTKLGLFFISISLYYFLKFYFPLELTYSNEIYLVITVLFAMLVLTGFFESIEVFLKRKFLSEFIFNDSVSLKNARRRFDLNAVISHVFPDMIKMSGNKSGKIIILTSKTERIYDSYSYEKGKRKKIKSGFKIDVSVELEKVLLKNKNGVSTAELIGNEEILDEINLFGASFILPFIFREKLFGFLAFPSPPYYEERSTLKILATKSAVAIFNNLLSSEIAIQKKYIREFEVAGKIEKNIFNYKIPNFSNLEFKSYSISSNIIIEFFNMDMSEKLLLVLVLKENSFGSEVIYSYTLGRIYSINSNKKNHDIKSLKNEIENLFKESSLEDSYEFLIASFSESNSVLTFLVNGGNLKINDQDDSSFSKVSSGWRYKVDLLKSKELFIFFKKVKIFTINIKQ